MRLCLDCESTIAYLWRTCQRKLVMAELLWTFRSNFLTNWSKNSKIDADYN